MHMRNPTFTLIFTFLTQLRQDARDSRIAIVASWPLGRFVVTLRSCVMTATTFAASPARSQWRAVTAASIGNALEWFDFVVYGFFAVTMAKLFFPTENETVSLLLALGTFGVTFVMRPLGAIVLGTYADQIGRASCREKWRCRS